MVNFNRKECYENGQVKEVYNVELDPIYGSEFVRKGPFQTYYENGVLATEGQYHPKIRVNGYGDEVLEGYCLDGECKKYRQDGSLSEQSVYRYAVPVEEKFYAKDGEMIAKRKYDNGELESEEYYEKGVIRIKKVFRRDYYRGGGEIGTLLYDKQGNPLLETKLDFDKYLYEKNIKKEKWELRRIFSLKCMVVYDYLLTYKGVSKFSESDEKMFREMADMFCIIADKGPELDKGIYQGIADGFRKISDKGPQVVRVPYRETTERDGVKRFIVRLAKKRESR